ncbi:MAG: trigger factor [Thioalkalispiraceae bacterium]|jgi:trigger factor
MQVSVESPSAIERRITVSVDENQIDEAVQKKLQKLSKTVNLKGFRAGKVPMNVVKQRYGLQAREEVLNDVIQSSFYEAISKEELKPAGMPDFEPKKSGPGEGLEYIATFEVYPEVEVKDMGNIEIERPTAEITDADLDKMLETIQKQHAAWEVIERAAKEGDKVFVDFVGTIEGEEFEGGTGQDMAVEIGKGQLIAGFEDGLVGLKAGDTKELDLSFPENYHKEDLAGKPVKFAITVKKVEETILPPIDAELAKKMGVEDGDMDKFREEIRSNMERELKNALENQTKKAVMDALLEAHEIEVPKALIQNEAQALAQQMMANMQQQGMPADQNKLPAEMFEGEAKRRVTLGLIMAEIVKQQGLKADEAAVKQKVEEIAEPYEQSEQVVKYYYGDKQRLAEIESLVIEEQIVNWILSQAKIADKSMTFNEIMYPNNQK